MVKKGTKRLFSVLLSLSIAFAATLVSVQNVRAVVPAITIADSNTLALVDGQTDGYWKAGTPSNEDPYPLEEANATNYNYHLFTENGQYVLEIRNVQMNNDAIRGGIAVYDAPIILRYIGTNSITVAEGGLYFGASGNFRIEDGDPGSVNDSLSLSAGHFGILCYGSLTFSGGIVSSSSSETVIGGIWSKKELTIEKGASVNGSGIRGLVCETILTIAEDAGDVSGLGSVGQGSIGIFASELYFKAENATLTASGQGSGHAIAATKAFFSGAGTVNAEALGSGYAIAGYEQLQISAGTVNATATNEGTAVYSESTNMEISGNAVVTAAGKHYGIKLNDAGDSKLTISGQAQVTASGGYCGISAGRGVKTDDDQVVVYSGEIDISGGTVNASCTEGSGPAIQANTKIAISGGEVNAAARGNTAILAGLRHQILNNNHNPATVIGDKTVSGSLTVSGGTVNAVATHQLSDENWFLEQSAGDNYISRLWVPTGHAAVLSADEIHLTDGHIIADGSGSASWTNIDPLSAPSEITMPIRYRLSSTDPYLYSINDPYQWSATQNYADIHFMEAVTFEEQGGSAVDDQMVPWGEAAVLPADPVRKYYHFEGWYTDAEGTQPYDFSAPVNADLTLYAKWTALIYQVSFDANGGSGDMAPITMPHGTLTLPENGFTAGMPCGVFRGWSLSADGEPLTGDSLEVTGDLTLYAIWGVQHQLTRVEAVQPGCTTPGNRAYYRCTQCGKLFSDEAAGEEISAQSVVIPALGHDFAEVWETDGTSHWHQCTRCGQKTAVSAHTFGPWVHTGSHTHECTVCGYQETEECTFGDWTVTEQPTATDTGEKERTCTKCGYVEITEVPATGQEETIPDTGDGQRLWLWGLLMAASLLAAATVERRRKPQI